jgi:GH25 family lysozyme M1 (1,4-beta-N-acetylmuramidase)
MNFDFHNIVGFDISKWQGNVDFAKMRDGGCSFVIVKAGQGNWADPMFETNWRNAKGVLPRASYWYYDNRYPPDAQARKYFDILRGDLEGMCWLDLEDRSTGVYMGWQGWFDFLEELKAVYPGAKIGIYSNFYYIVEMLSFATKAQRDYFGKYPLWLANYGLDAFHPAYSSIMVPLPWLECLILQSGTPAIGLDAGVESLEIDYNQFNGDMAKFSQYFKLSSGEVITSDPVLPPPQEGETMQGTIKPGYALKIRDATGADTGKRLIAGDVVYGAVTGGRIYFHRVYRLGTVVEETPGNAATVDPANPATAFMYLADVVEPVTPPATETFPPRVGLTIGTTTKYYIPE